jgi:hypothetical protein
MDTTPSADWHQQIELRVLGVGQCEDPRKEDSQSATNASDEERSERQLTKEKTRVSR